MDKRIKLYKILDSLYFLYIKVRSNPEDHELVKELNHSIFQLQMKIENPNGVLKPYYQTSDKLTNPFIHKKYKSYDYKRAVTFLQILIIANFSLTELMNNKKFEKASTMASSLHNLPSFLLGRYKIPSAQQFYDEHICFYGRVHGESFLEPFKPVFYGEMTDQDEIIKLRIFEMKKIYQRRSIEQERYVWEIAKCIYSESKNFRAIIFEKSACCYKIRYEQLLYDEYVDFWYWSETNGQLNTFVESVLHAEELIQNEFKIIDCQY